VILVTGPEVVGDADSRRVLPYHQGGSIRRADGRRRIGIGEPHALLRQSIKIGRFVKCITVTAQFGPTEIVCQNENNIGLSAIRRLWFHHGGEEDPAGSAEADDSQKVTSCGVACVHGVVGHRGIP